MCLLFRFSILCFSFIFTLLCKYAVAQGDSWYKVKTENVFGNQKSVITEKPQCTENVIAVPSCNFDQAFCSYWDVSNSTLHWKLASRLLGKIEHGWEPNAKYPTGKFAYIKNENGSHDEATATISSLAIYPKKSVCVQIHYATIGAGVIKLYIQPPYTRAKRQLIGKIEDNTTGLWKNETFIIGCMPPEKSVYSIVIEGKTEDTQTIVAMDYVKVTFSTQKCQTIQPTPYLTNVTTDLESTHSASTVSSQNNPHCSNRFTGLPSCSFRSNFCSYAQKQNNLKWMIASKIDGIIDHDWQPSLLRKNDKFAYVQRDKNITENSSAALYSNILSRDVSSVCIQLHYATVGIGVVKVFSMRDFFHPEDVHLVGTIKEDTSGKWKEHTFIASCIGTHTTIGIIAELQPNTTVIAIDYLKVTHATETCPTTN